MTDRPILFSAPMVRALLDGSKTQTRRVVKQDGIAAIEYLGGQCDNEPITTDDFSIEWSESYDEDGGKRKKYRAQWCVRSADYPEEGVLPIGSAYGQPGDRLWVRETWQGPILDCEEHEVQFREDGPEAFKKPGFCAYRATDKLDAIDADGKELGWRPSIFMPRWVSRITLEITGVRIERLQDISDADAIAEGIPRGGPENPDGIERLEYRTLWEQINGPGSWEANPWVWVIEFKRVKP
jgi:hypothetical protein